MTSPGAGTAASRPLTPPAHGDISGPGAARPRLAFVGTGWIGRERMRVALEHDAVEVAALVDPAAVALQAAREFAPEALCLGSLAEALKQGPEGVVIASPSALHAMQALEALEAGVPVFCQKPLGRTAAEARRVVQAAAQRDLRLGADFAYRETAFAGNMRSLIASGALGSVYAVDLTFHNAYGPDGAWFYDPALSGGGCLVDLGIHLVDLALWLLDFPDVRSSRARLLSGGEPLGDPAPAKGGGGPDGKAVYPPGDRRRGGVVEDYATAELRLDGGTCVRLVCSWNLHAGKDAVIEAYVRGTEGGLSMRNLGGSFYDFELDLARGTRCERLCAPPDAWPGRTLLRWARDVGRGCGFNASAWRFVDVAAVLDDLYAGAEA